MIDRNRKTQVTEARRIRPTKKLGRQFITMVTSSEIDTEASSRVPFWNQAVTWVCVCMSNSHSVLGQTTDNPMSSWRNCRSSTLTIPGPGVLNENSLLERLLENIIQTYGDLWECPAECYTDPINLKGLKVHITTHPRQDTPRRTHNFLENIKPKDTGSAVCISTSWVYSECKIMFYVWDLGRQPHLLQRWCMQKSYACGIFWYRAFKGNFK